MIKRTIFLTAILSCLFASICLAGNTNIQINGRPVSFSNDSGYPYVDENNRTMVPLRATMEALGASVGYDSKTDTAIVIREDIRVEIPIGTNKIYYGNAYFNRSNSVENDTVAVTSNGRTYLPMRAVLECLNYTVEWDNTSKTVSAYNYDFNSQALTPYSTSDINTLISAISNGYVVVINGQYYSTPKLDAADYNAKYHYLNADLNISKFSDEN